VATRGRAVAVRDTSNRVGLLAGPIVGGLIGVTLGLRYIFLFIAATKVAVIIVTVLWIREARRQRRAASPPAAGVGPKRRPWLPSVDLAMFRTRAFLALSLGTISVSLVVGGTGVFRTLFPPHASGVVGLDTAQIGTLIAISGAFALLGSIPTGMAADRWGRKKPLLAGLLLTAVATYLMAGAESYASAGVAVVVFGVAEALAFGTIQVYAMDLAPPDRRGAFLGVWSLFMNIGQITGPLVIGTIADTFSFSSAFITVSIALVVGAAMVALFGTETGGRNRSLG
jgi:MFS family permease